MYASLYSNKYYLNNSYQPNFVDYMTFCIFLQESDFKTDHVWKNVIINLNLPQH